MTDNGSCYRLWLWRPVPRISSWSPHPSRPLSTAGLHWELRSVFIAALHHGAHFPWLTPREDGTADKSGAATSRPSSA